MAMSKPLSDPYSYRGKNGVDTGKVPIGHFRRQTLVPGKESDARPELSPKQAEDGRKGGQ